MIRYYTSLLVSLAILGLFAGCKEDPVVTFDPKTRLADMPFETLSEYQFFDGPLAELNPQDDVLPYELNMPLFSNYALKSRFIWLPEGYSAEYNDTDIFDLPIGTIIVKTFYYDNDFRDPSLGRNILETRLMIRQDTGWMSEPYLWRQDQTEADWHIVGRQTQVEWIHYDGTPRSTLYLVPNSVECAGCHNVDNKMFPIGPKARNINGMMDYADGPMNQLDKWTEEGILTGTPSAELAPAVPRMDDLSASINDRARAYLDINCGHCHSPRGPANNSGLNLDYFEQDPTKLGICKTPIAAGQGSGGLEYAIVPGNPDDSFMVFRMNSVELNIAMPELSRSVIHDEGVQLIRDWILTLEGDCL